MESKFKKGDVVYILMEAFKDEMYMVATTPKRQFEMGHPYIVKEVVEWGGGIRVLVWESSNFIREKYFSMEKQDAVDPSLLTTSKFDQVFDQLEEIKSELNLISDFFLKNHKTCENSREQIEALGSLVRHIKSGLEE